MPLIQVFDISRVPPDPDGSAAWALDSPVDTQQFDGTDLQIAGWAVAADGVEAVDILVNRRSVRRTLVNRPRADVGLLYPNLPGSARSGFQSTVSLVDWAEVLISVIVITRSGAQLPIAHISAGRAWGERARAGIAPLVAVVVAAEGLPACAAAIEAVRSQTYPHHEVVVITGEHGGPERTSTSYSGWVRTIPSSEPSVAGAWNTGLRRTVGDYLIFLRATECLLPEALQRGLAAFAEHQESALVLGHREDPERAPQTRCSDDSNLGLFRRSVFDVVGVFDRDAADPRADLSGRIARQFPVHCHHHAVVISAASGSPASE